MFITSSPAAAQLLLPGDMTTEGLSFSTCCKCDCAVSCVKSVSFRSVLSLLLHPEHLLLDEPPNPSLLILSELTHLQMAKLYKRGIIVMLGRHLTYSSFSKIH